MPGVQPSFRNPRTESMSHLRRVVSRGAIDADACCALHVTMIQLIINVGNI
jgi:hypothetical protein